MNHQVFQKKPQKNFPENKINLCSRKVQTYLDDVIDNRVISSAESFNFAALPRNSYLKTMDKKKFTPKREKSRRKNYFQNNETIKHLMNRQKNHKEDWKLKKDPIKSCSFA